MPDQTDTPVILAATPPEEAKNTAPAAENLIPQSRLNEVIAERNALKAAIEKEAKAREAAETKRLEEQNQYRTRSAIRRVDRKSHGRRSRSA